jgi:hypothetical protein
VDVAGDRGDDPEPAAGVLQPPALLDVRLDPADQVVERVRAVAPARRLAAGRLGRLPERAAGVELPSKRPPWRFESQWDRIPNAGAPAGTFLATSVPTESSSTVNPGASSGA